jgi:hypothetical protein
LVLVLIGTDQVTFALIIGITISHFTRLTWAGGSACYKDKTIKM